LWLFKGHTAKEIKSLSLVFASIMTSDSPGTARKRIDFRKASLPMSPLTFPVQAVNPVCKSGASASSPSSAFPVEEKNYIEFHVDRKSGKQFACLGAQ
jgi:hypothetical protein